MLCSWRALNSGNVRDPRSSSLAAVTVQIFCLLEISMQRVVWLSDVVLGGRTTHLRAAQIEELMVVHELTRWDTKMLGAQNQKYSSKDPISPN